jgi:hypothetical protein
MASERVERDQFVLRGPAGEVFSNWPIHFAGASVLMRNASEQPVTVEVHESNDGTNWTLVLFSTHAAAGLLNITMVGLSFAVILFMSEQKYVRIRLTAENGDGVFCSLVQYPPKPREGAGEYA